MPCGGLGAGHAGRVALLERAALVDGLRVGGHLLRGAGIGIVESVPWKSPPMYSRVRFSPPPATAGLGPSRLALEAAPLPLAT